MGSVWWESGCSNAAPGREGRDVNADGSLYTCHVLFHCSPQRQVLPSSRPAASLQLVLGQMFPDGGFSRASPYPTAHHPLLLTAPSAPTSRGCALPPACTAWCILNTAAPKSLLLCRVTTWCCLSETEGVNVSNIVAAQVLLNGLLCRTMNPAQGRNRR